MGKGKKKGSKKAKKLERDALDVAAESIRKYRRVSKEIGKLSTTQKIVGGIGLLAAAIAYVANKQAIDDFISTDSVLPSLVPGKTEEKPPKPEALPPKSAGAPRKPVKRRVADKS
ncbi:hypothetical protein GCM10011375_21160 [Hymenobacter qilianensis]|uniref:Uncharacterized protein n=2 Tax=Hymenobacter qilianensis TaxID=1385715 RepID=A0ACB5PRR7_9BACT|nr:hypothetical protein [Hymenobacter qilianensis]QNP52256.1 hypothetical protein H9L05_00005 [Hymenobacter qilianensis]GGF65902.1 hypothetical protein GCM10011375_21160 [Hymenobacter qilianensis]